MSVESALDYRYALWLGIVTDFGYEESDTPRPSESENDLALRFVRQALGEVQAVVFDIRESWYPGGDPELGLMTNGCWLVGLSWNAQILRSEGATGAERLDVDRSKPPELRIHRHPFGQPNNVRYPAVPLRNPLDWLVHVETIIADHYLRTQDD